MISKQGTIILYKSRGETPLKCLERFKFDNPEYKNEKMTYAGRLDPLAEGLLLVLVGNECKNREKYLGLDKIYEVDVLFGFATDTYDVLGKVTSCLCEQSEANQDYSRLLHVVRNDLQKTLKTFVGRFSQKYPPFSSRNIKSILEARNNEDKETTKNGVPSRGELPEKEVEIKNIEIIGERTISKNDLEKYIKDSISLVEGDFRQKEILEIWESVFNGTIRTNERIKDNQEFKIVSIKVNCTSGTYMRSLANSIGEKIGVPALTLNIKRTKIGKFEI